MNHKFIVTKTQLFRGLENIIMIPQNEIFMNVGVLKDYYKSSGVKDERSS